MQEQSINYHLIGEFLMKCAALEFEIDFFLFAAADFYKERLTDDLRSWPQQARDKCSALFQIMNGLMRFPPDPKHHGFSDMSILSGCLDRVYHVRNLLIHGTPIDRLGPDAGLHLCKASRAIGKPQRFIFAPEFVSNDEINELISILCGAILLVDAAMFGLRRERRGWLNSDTSGLPPTIKLTLIDERTKLQRLTEPTQTGEVNT